MVPDLDPDKPDPDPVWPDLDPAISGSGSGLPGSRSGNIRIWIRLLPDLDPVAAGSKVPHELSGPVQALPWRVYSNLPVMSDDLLLPDPWRIPASSYLPFPGEASLLVPTLRGS